MPERRKQAVRVVSWFLGIFILVPVLIIAFKWTDLDISYVIPITFLVFIAYCMIAIRNILRNSTWTM